jgi:hypothetical protein
MTTTFPKRRPVISALRSARGRGPQPLNNILSDRDLPFPLRDPPAPDATVQAPSKRRENIKRTTPIQTFRVKLASALLESMTLATVEAYAYRRPGRQSTKGVETHGYVWGGRTVHANGEVIFSLDQISISLTAKRCANSVAPNLLAGLVKQDLFKGLAPHQMLIADFHSHPYPSIKAVARTLGYEFSEHDIDDFLDDDFLWNAADNNPIMLLQTVCRRQGKASPTLERRGRNVIAFDVREYRFWVNAIVGYLDKEGQRRHTGNVSRMVRIDPMPLVSGLMAGSTAALGQTRRRRITHLPPTRLGEREIN